MRSVMATLVAASMAVAAHAAGPSEAAGSEAPGNPSVISTENAVYRIDIWDVQPVPIVVSGAPTGPDQAAPVFKICNHPESRMPATLRVFIESPGEGPAHPSVATPRLPPGNCVFASGPRIEAFLHPDSLEADGKTRDWLEGRIAALQEETRTLTDPRQIEVNQVMIAEFTARASAHPVPRGATLSVAVAAQ